VAFLMDGDPISFSLGQRLAHEQEEYVVDFEFLAIHVYNV